MKPSVVDDVYLTLVERPDAEGRATIRIVVEPLVSWLWAGGAVMVAGTVAALIPSRTRRRPEPTLSVSPPPSASASAPPARAAAPAEAVERPVEVG